MGQCSLRVGCVGGHPEAEVPQLLAALPEGALSLIYARRALLRRPQGPHQVRAQLHLTPVHSPVVVPPCAHAGGSAQRLLAQRNMVSRSGTREIMLMCGCACAGTGMGKTPMFDTRKAREELGIRFLSPEVMLWDEAARLHELGLVKRWFGLF